MLPIIVLNANPTPAPIGADGLPDYKTYIAANTLPAIIDGPGEYLTRSGDIVEITTPNGSFNWNGVYRAERITELWHRSGRRFAMQETAHDIVSKASLSTGGSPNTWAGVLLQEVLTERRYEEMYKRLYYVRTS